MARAGPKTAKEGYGAGLGSGSRAGPGRVNHIASITKKQQ